ncbi:MAG TPA: type II 3-dehydroquinate dehydratase [Oceanipulchritudo sp.]|nr:type II 3-dehydroquinate dehydratase [Oceanipulchritudo sp.]
MKKIAILNGPNLHRLGKREPEVYGTQTLDDIMADLKRTADQFGAEIEHFQSNHEGDLIEKIHAWSDAGITLGIINPAGLTHTSVALRDAISASPIRFVEVHLSHIYRREEFRHHSVTAPACVAQVTGMGAQGYQAALHYLLNL